MSNKRNRSALINSVQAEAMRLQQFTTTDMLLQFPNAPASTVKSILTLLRHKGILTKKGKGPWRLSNQQLVKLYHSGQPISRAAAIQLINYIFDQTETQWHRDETTKISGATIDPDTWWLWA